MKPDITKPAVRAELKAHYELHSSGDALIITHCFDYIDRLEADVKEVDRIMRRIADAGAKLFKEPHHATLPECVEKLLALSAEVDRLEKAANKLPKDAEGVHCGPGDRRWAWTHPGGGKAAVLQGGVFWEPGGEPDWRIGFGIKAHPAGVFAGFSTKEAAENCAALAQQAKDTEHGSDTEG